MNPSSCDDIRAAGLVVDMHCDRVINGDFVTHWIFSTDGGQTYESLGSTDEEALTKIRFELGLPTHEEVEG